MKDEKQQPTPEQIAQWKKEAIEYADGHYNKQRDPQNWNDRYQGYYGGRRKSFEEVVRLQGELTSLKEDRDNWKSEAYEEQNRAARNHQLIVSLQADLERVTKERDRYREDYQNISYRTYGGTNP